ncbi:hypothetical protein BSP15_138 [Bacillus phage BSP15]|nr:hypothetical protein BSP15_138 [Bacillus phage BSP15]
MYIIQCIKEKGNTFFTKCHLLYSVFILYHTYWRFSKSRPSKAFIACSIFSRLFILTSISLSSKLRSCRKLFSIADLLSKSLVDSSVGVARVSIYSSASSIKRANACSLPFSTLNRLLSVSSILQWIRAARVCP